MTDRSWLVTFADAAVLSDLFDAARDCMAELDDCDPELCAHPEQLMMPIGLPQWIEREIHIAAQQLAAQQPSRFERGHRPRRLKDGRRSLAIAG